MRVLLINTTYGRGGASQIVANLHSEFRHLGADSRVMVDSTDDSHDAHVRVFRRRRGLLERVTNRVSCRIGLNNNGILHSFGLRRDQDVREATILNLHNLHGGYFNFLALPQLTRETPAVLTLHDMWAFTGHCVYSFDCERWKTGCGDCPSPNIYPRIRRDATRLEYRLKRRSLLKSRLHIVAISRWMRDLAQESFLGGLPIHHIPNGIDIETFQPRPQAAARQLLGLPRDKRIILYVVHHINDPRKGFDLLVKALARVPAWLREKCLLLVMGEADARLQEQIGMKAAFLGFVADENRKADAYAAADVVAFPSRADNLPVVLQESLACGRPMVSFAVGGIPDLVRDEETGFAAPAEEIACFAEHLQRLLERDELRLKLGLRCRTVAEKEFSLRLQAQRYLDLFEEIGNGIAGRADSGGVFRHRTGAML